MDGERQRESLGEKSQGGVLDPQLSIIVPTLNEAENIDELFARIAALGERCPRLEVVVVDDASSDGTPERVLAWRERLPVRLIRREAPRDLSGAVLDAAAQARADVVLVMDADLSHPVEMIPELAAPVIAGKADVAIGSRSVATAEVVAWPLRRKLGSWLARALCWPFCDARDPLAGFFAVRRSELRARAGGARGFKILLELLARGGDELRVVELPIRFADRARGQSKVRLRTVFRFLAQLIELAGGEPGSRRVQPLQYALVASCALDALVFAGVLAHGEDLAQAQLAGAAAALLATGLANLDALRTRAAGALTPPWVRLVLTSVAAAVLRGGVLAHCAALVSSPLLAFLPALLVGLAVSWVGATFYVYAPARRPQAQRVAVLRVGCLAATAYLLALRVLYAGRFELLPEEAYYWSYSQHLALGYLDHPPLIAWLGAGTTWLAGANEWGVRLVALGCSVVTLCFVFARAAYGAGKSAAAVAVALASALPFGFLSGVLSTPDAPLAAAWAGALFFLELALVDERPGAYWGVSVCLGLGLLAKYTIALLVPAALVFMMIDRRSRAQLASAGPYLAALGAALLFAPVLIWNAKHHWASFAFQGPHRWSQPAHFGVHSLLAHAALLLTPIGVCGLLALGALRGRGDRAARHLRFAVVFAAVPFAVFALYGLRHVPKVNWTGPVWLAVLPALGALIAEPRGERARRAARMLVPTLQLGIVGWGIGLYLFAFGLPGTHWLSGSRYEQRWRATAALVERVAAEVRAATGNTPVIVAFDRYGTASLLQFYQPPETPRWTVAGRNLFGDRQSLMYSEWVRPESVAGRDLVLISDDPRDLQVPEHFAHRRSEILRLPVASSAPIFYRVLFDYVPELGDSGRKRKNAAASSTAVSGASSSHIEPSSRMPSAARASRPSSSGVAGFALPSDSSSFGTHSGRGSPLVSNTSAFVSGPSLNTHRMPEPRSSPGTVNIAARPRSPSSSSSNRPSTSG
jgi:dolichol-phosphate mannosyltransferase